MLSRIMSKTRTGSYCMTDWCAAVAFQSFGKSLNISPGWVQTGSAKVPVQLGCYNAFAAACMSKLLLWAAMSCTSKCTGRIDP
eukprot:221340-Amphidinium_carterae.1